MSHQTGIKGSEALRQFFGRCKDGSVRLMKVAIENEELVLTHSDPPKGTWEDDYDKLVKPQLRPKEPCYILYRTDSADGTGYKWILINYVPDDSSVRLKMLYAATKSTMKLEFGSDHIKEELNGTCKEDVVYDGYLQHLNAAKAPPPLTMAEEELAEIKKNETRVEVGVDSKQQTLTGIAFPVSQEALKKMAEMSNGRGTYVQLSIDIKKEAINLESCEDTDVATLPSRIPSDHGRYHLFKYKHHHEGDYLESICFIYSMPGYKCPIKERMLYSSCKAPLIDVIENQLQIQLAKKIEIDDAAELTEEFIYDEVHPKQTIVRQQFAKPKGPKGRGPKRVTKRCEQN